MPNEYFLDDTFFFYKLKKKPKPEFFLRVSGYISFPMSPVSTFLVAQGNFSAQPGPWDLFLLHGAIVMGVGGGGSKVNFQLPLCPCPYHSLPFLTIPMTSSWICCSRACPLMNWRLEIWSKSPYPLLTICYNGIKVVPTIWGTYNKWRNS